MPTVDVGAVRRREPKTVDVLRPGPVLTAVAEERSHVDLVQLAALRGSHNLDDTSREASAQLGQPQHDDLSPAHGQSISLPMCRTRICIPYRRTNASVSRSDRL